MPFASSYATSHANYIIFNEEWISPHVNKEFEFIWKKIMWELWSLHFDKARLRPRLGEKNCTMSPDGAKK